MQCVFLSPDMMFSSRMLGAATAAGIGLKIVPAVAKLPDALTAECRLLLIDLTTAGLDLPQIVQTTREQSPQAQILAYGPHVEEEALAAAQAAGCDRVLTRGQFNQRFGEIVKEAAQAGA